MIVIGYGTGRCGTMSLARFLNQQPGFNVTHESVALSWHPTFSDTDSAMKDFTSRDARVIGDVGFYWIQYLDRILRKYKGAKAINIWRDDEEVIESYWSYVGQVQEHNQWKGFPYDSPDQTKDAIAFTVSKYRFLENEAQKIYPGSIYRMHVDELNHKGALADLLDWLNVDRIRDMNPIHTNKREHILSGNAHKGRLFGRRSKEKSWHHDVF